MRLRIRVSKTSLGINNFSIFDLRGGLYKTDLSEHNQHLRELLSKH